MRSIKVKLFGVTVLEYSDDAGESVVEALQRLAELGSEQEDVVDDGHFIMSSNTDYMEPEMVDGGRVIFEPNED